jgi:hypothetical protein
VGLLSDWEATLKDYLWLNFPPSLAASYNWDAPLDSMLTAVHRSGDHALAQQIAEEVRRKWILRRHHPRYSRGYKTHEMYESTNIPSSSLEEYTTVHYEPMFRVCFR